MSREVELVDLQEQLNSNALHRGAVGLFRTVGRLESDVEHAKSELATLRAEIAALRERPTSQPNSKSPHWLLKILSPSILSFLVVILVLLLLLLVLPDSDLLREILQRTAP